MSELKYTSGPWRAVRGDDIVFVEVVNIAHIGVSGGDAYNAQFVVQAAPGSKGSLPHDANLIAAAPDMLEALEGAKRVIDEIYKHPDFSEYLAGHPSPVRDAINAAISKAKGESK